MSKHTLSTEIRTASELSRFITCLREKAINRNADLRVLGHQKSLHMAAEALGFDSYQQYKAYANRTQFVSELMEKGFSLSYADAVMLTHRETLASADDQGIHALVADVVSKVSSCWGQSKESAENSDETNEKAAILVSWQPSK